MKDGCERNLHESGLMRHTQQAKQQTKLSAWARGFVFLSAVSHCVG